MRICWGNDSLFHSLAYTPSVPLYLSLGKHMPVTGIPVHVRLLNRDRGSTYTRYKLQESPATVYYLLRKNHQQNSKFQFPKSAMGLASYPFSFATFQMPRRWHETSKSVFPWTKQSTVDQRHSALLFCWMAYLWTVVCVFLWAVKGNSRRGKGWMKKKKEMGQLYRLLFRGDLIETRKIGSRMFHTIPCWIVDASTFICTSIIIWRRCMFKHIF